jgi:hypothetical protein
MTLSSLNFIKRNSRLINFKVVITFKNFIKIFFKKNYIYLYLGKVKLSTLKLKYS